MAAIKTDQLRIKDAKRFVDAAISGEDIYYTFIGLPNATEYDSNWDASPIAPKDSFDDENSYWDTMLALKRVAPNGFILQTIL